MNKQRSIYGNSIKKDEQFANQFYRYYDKETIDVDGEKIGKYNHVMKNIIKTKVKEWIDFLYCTYQIYIEDLKEIKREKKKNPDYRKKLMYPPCFLYKDHDIVFTNYNGVQVKGKKTNFIQYIQHNIYIPNVKKDKGFKVEKSHIENFIVNNVFMKYYEKIISSIKNNEYNKIDFTFDNLHNLILNPIKEIKYSYMPSKFSIEDV